MASEAVRNLSHYGRGLPRLLKELDFMFQPQCKAIGCYHPAIDEQDFCAFCKESLRDSSETELTLAQRYPKYYKSVESYKEIDVYAVHFLFDIQDASGCLQHASKKLLLSGVRTGGKSVYADVKEARDSLSRWLELNESRKN